MGSGASVLLAHNPNKRLEMAMDLFITITEVEPLSRGLGGLGINLDPIEHVAFLDLNGTA